MQYKFFVDGEWRHDEQQTCISGEYGVVNTVLLATEPSYAAPLANPEMAPGSSMDVDNDTFRRLVRIIYTLLLLSLYLYAGLSYWCIVTYSYWDCGVRFILSLLLVSDN